MANNQFRKKLLVALISTMFVGSAYSQAFITGGSGTGGEVINGDMVYLNGPLDLGATGSVTIGDPYLGGGGSTLQQNLFLLNDGQGGVGINHTTIAITNDITNAPGATSVSIGDDGNITATGTIQSNFLNVKGTNAAASIDGTLGVTGATTTAGITNTGDIKTTTLNVTGATTTNGIDNNSQGITEAGAISGATTITASGNVSSGSLTTWSSGSTNKLGGFQSTNTVGGFDSTNTIGGAFATNVIQGDSNTIGGNFADNKIYGETNTMTAYSSTGGVNNIIANHGTTYASSPGINNITATGDKGQNNLTAAYNTITGTTQTSITGGTSSALLSDAGAVVDGNNAKMTLNNTDASVLNSTGHGLTITDKQTTLTGGTNSSSLTLEDAAATLKVGTSSTDEIQVIQATNNDGTTEVAIGGNKNYRNYLEATAPGGVNYITATRGNVLSAGVNKLDAVSDNILNAGGQNKLIGGTGNVITATTGDNAISALDGSNNLTATIQNNIEAPVNNIGVATKASVNTIGNAGTSVNVMQGDTNTITGATSTTVNGGTTQMVVNNAGVTLSGTETGGTAKITGVADGTSQYDAVNYGQLKGVEKLASRGVAAATAMANIPQVDQNKTFSVGAGVGSYNGYAAVAVGASYRMAPNAVLKASVGTGSEGKTAFGVGAGFSW